MKELNELHGAFIIQRHYHRLETPPAPLSKNVDSLVIANKSTLEVNRLCKFKVRSNHVPDDGRSEGLVNLMAKYTSPSH